MADTKTNETIENIKKDLPTPEECFGQDPEVLYETIKDTIEKNIPDIKERTDGAIFAQIQMPGKEPDEEGKIQNGGVVMKDLDAAIRTTAKNLSEGISTENENGKKPKFTVPLGRAEAESLRAHTKASAINYIQNKIRDAAFAAGWTEQDLHASQQSVNFKNQGSRGASIKTTGIPIIESLAEIIYTSSVHGKEMNVEGVKDNCEKNLGTKHDTGMQAGNMIDDMIFGGGDDIEKTNEGYTYSPS